MKERNKKKLESSYLYAGAVFNTYKIKIKLHQGQQNKKKDDLWKFKQSGIWRRLFGSQNKYVVEFEYDEKCSGPQKKAGN